jgi:hypothetical protein
MSCRVVSTLTWSYWYYVDRRYSTTISATLDSAFDSFSVCCWPSRRPKVHLSAGSRLWDWPWKRSRVGSQLYQLAKVAVVAGK